MKDTTTRAIQEFIDAHPRPGGGPVEHLRHVVAVFHDSPADDYVLTASSNIYGDGIKTGLTHGDLRALLQRLGG